MMQGQEQLDMVRFDENRARVSDQILAGFRGKHVAWKADGTKVLASGETVEEVLASLDQQGVDPLTTVLDFIPNPASSYLG